MTETNRNPTETTLDPERKAHLQAAKRVVLLTVFLDILGFGIVIPQIGIYAAQFGATPWVIGLLASAYSAMQFLFSPFWGGLSDRIGRRPVLLWSIFGSALGYVLFAAAASMPWLFASRIISGVTGANISTAQAYLTDVTEPEDRSKTFGLFGAIFGVGFAVGPAIGWGLSHLPGIWGGNLGVGVFTAILSFVNWFLALKMLPETLTTELQESNVARHADRGGSRWQIFNKHGYQSAFAIPNLSLLIAISFISMLAFATLQTTFTIYIIAKYVRPEVQSYIKHQPKAAVVEAQRRMSVQSSRPPTVVSGEGETPSLHPATAGSNRKGDVLPYSAAMGGDFRPTEPAPPPGLSWRYVEQLLVQPRASALVGSLFTVIGILSLIVQGGMIGPLKKRFGEVNLIIYGTLIMAIAFIFVPLPHHFLGQFPVSALIAFGNGISSPVMTAFVSLLSPEAERGEILGIFQSTQSLARILGPALGGFLFDHVSMGAPYFVGGAIMLFAFVISLGLRVVRSEAIPVEVGT